MKITKRRALVVGALIIGTSVLAAGPAMAEGSWSSSISGAVTGFQSRSWQDSNLDNVETRVVFSGCSVDGGQTFTKTQLEMWGEFGAFPDQNLGNISNTCNTSNWGRVANNSYHFRVNTINGTTSGYHLSVTTNNTYY
ncbi:hypothetical protein [Glaciihabitans sp. UYNi722]|uniref:hypothetical protein n=1 Tax=Glaciihabitans sp. UYNi722 TaxID=3156344 RepID=UPI003396830B